MSIVTSKKGQLESLKLMLSVRMILRLYENNTLPDYYYEIGDYREVTGGGYKTIALDPEGWKFSFLADDPVATYPDQVFEFTGTVG